MGQCKLKRFAHVEQRNIISPGARGKIFLERLYKCGKV